MPEVFSAAQVGEVLGLSPLYVRKWLKAQGVVKTLSSYHITPKELERLKRLRAKRGAA